MLYKRELINSFETIGYSCCIMMSIVIGPKWSFYSCCNYIGLLGTGFMQVMYSGRAPHTKETARFSEVASGNSTSTCIPRVNG